MASILIDETENHLFSENILSEIKVQSFQGKTLNTMDIDPGLLNGDFDVEEFEKIECSYLKYSGGLKSEKGYVCSQCNPTKNLIMCQYCYNNCHKDCTKIKTDQMKEMSNFSCYCGEKLKHKKPEPKKEKNFKPCKMLNFDKRIGSKRHYYCSKHNIKICSICAKECHTNCDNVLASNEDLIGCECADKTNHNDFNEFTFNFAQMQTKKGDENILTNLWPIQAMNLLFETKIFKKLELFVKNQIESIKERQSNFVAPFPRVIGLFSDTFNSKFKTFYFHENIMQMFKYSSLISFIRKIDTSTIGAKMIKFRLLYVMLFIHLKKDFQLIKNLTSIDFISGNLIERLLYKKYMLTESIYTKEILQKYQFLNENDPNYLNGFAIKEVSEFLKEAILSNMPLEEYNHEFEIGIKFLCFLLKKMVFNQKEIEKMTDDLFVIQAKLIDIIEKDINKLNFLEDIFKGIIELNLLLAVNYNDIIIYNYLLNSKKNKFSPSETLGQFIHCKNESGENIFKMTIKNCKIIKQHYNENSIQFHPKVLIEFDLVFRLFSIVDNFYYYQIKVLKEEDIDNFYDVINIFENFKMSLPDMIKEIGEKHEDRESGEQLLNFNIQRVIPLGSNNSILETKMSIEIFLNTYFTVNFNKPGEMFYSIYQEIESFLKKLNNSMGLKTKNQPYNKGIGKSFSSIQEKKQFNFNLKVKASISRFFSHIQKLTDEQINEFITHLSYASIDETLFKVLILFSTQRYVNQITFEALDLILAFLSFFFLSKKGMNYFLIGKNITRMNKIFNRFRLRVQNKNISVEKNRSKQSNMRFSTRILEFIYLVTKGISIFDLSLNEHKVLNRFKENLLEHLQLFSEQKDVERDPAFKVHLNLCASIFLFLKDMYSIENFEVIKDNFWTIFKKTNLMYYSKLDFLSDFIKEMDDMGRPVKNKNLSGEEVKAISTKGKPKKKGINEGYLISEESSYNRGQREDPFHTYILSEADPSKNWELNETLYFNFFRMIALRTYYTNAESIDEKFMNLPSLDDLEIYKENFKNPNLSIKIRRVFLEFLFTFLFADYLDLNDIKKCLGALTTNEFIKFENSKKYEDKYKKLLVQEKVIDIIIQEIAMFPSQIEKFTDSIEEIDSYIFGLIFSIKSIANFYFFNKKIWCRSIITFYNLVKELANKSDCLKQVYFSISNECQYKPYEKQSPNNNKYYLTLCQRKFDIFNKDKLYSITHKLIKNIITGTKSESYSSLESYLRQYDKLKDYNFSPPSFIEKQDYEYFYTMGKDINGHDPSPSDLKIEEILGSYIDEFTNFESTSFFEITSGIFDESDQIDYRKEILNFLIQVIKNQKVPLSKLYFFFTFINKMLFYDNSGTREDLQCLKKDCDECDECEEFFSKFNQILHKSFVHTYITCNNIKVPEMFLMYSNITKLLIQFLELLGEGFNKDFHSNMFTLFNYIKSPTPSPSQVKINGIIKKNEKTKAKTQQKTQSKTQQKKQPKTQQKKEPVPIDSSQIPEEKQDIIPGVPNELLGKLNDKAESMPFYIFIISNLINVYQYLNLSEQLPFEVPFDKLIVLNNSLIDVITSYISSERSEVNENIEILFSHIVFKCLLLKSDMNNKLRSDLICFIKTNYLGLVNSFFQKGSEKEQIRRFTKLLSPSQLFEEILHHMQALFNFLNFNKKLPLFPDKKFISTLLEHYIYDKEFRNSLQLNLCLQYFILIKFYEDIYQITTLKQHLEKIQLFPDVERDYYGINTKFAVKINLFFEQLVLKVDIRMNSKEAKETFFVRPYITYHLSSQTKESFELNVDRTSTSSKLNELLFYTDYFSFEMATNARILGKSLWSGIMRKILIKYIEYISYIILIAHNVLMMIINYKDVNLDIEEYNAQHSTELYNYDKENLYLAIAQAIMLIIVLILWFYYKFPLYYQFYILRLTGKKFIFKKLDNEADKENTQVIKDYFDEEKENIGIMGTLQKLNSSIKPIKRFKIALVDAFLLNREISIIFYTLIFLIIYLVRGCIIWLALPLLFLFNSVPTLYNVFSVVKNHLLALLSIVLFICIVSYNFMWISFHFMSNLFYFDLLVYDTKEKNESEALCTSSIQCFLHILEYFVIQGGPDTDYLSFKRDTPFYLIGFFYDLLFFLIILLVLYNVFLGVLYDTFSELRGNLQEKENDIKNVCFICQLTRDGSLAKRIDFNEHVNGKHYMWNYVYFMIYLHISNSNDFDTIQTDVWDKLAVQDNSWIPQKDDC